MIMRALCESFIDWTKKDISFVKKKERKTIVQRNNARVHVFGKDEDHTCTHARNKVGERKKEKDREEKKIITTDNIAVAAVAFLLSFLCFCFF